MEEPYKHAVFFECPGLDKEQRKRLENYFHIYRKSGGGDCGSIKTINDNLYSIAFKEREAQKRVLQRSEHVLEIAGGPLVLTVRGSPEPPPHSPITTLTTSKSVSPNLDSTSSQSQQSSLTSSLPSGDDRNWKTEVAKLFDGYLCHYETDSYKVKALLESGSSPPSTDEVKVYSEVGMAVVVGERSQVNARLTNVEHRSGTSEKQTSIRRLGEAKLRLLWREIEHCLGQDCPGVKVTKGAAGQVVLEGSAEEILKAGNWISDQEKWVSEKMVSDMSAYFLVFLRRAYGSSGALGQFLGLSDKVEVELRDTEIRIFSLSADEMNDTAKKLHGKFAEVKIDVPNCSTVPSELQEKLKSKTKEMNQGQYRAEVVFGSDGSVWLLGHAKQVDELKEAVTQFILDQSSIEGQVSLPYPELAQELPGLLQLHGFDYSGVIFHPLPFSSEPMVVLEGPSSKVTEVRNRLGPFLGSLVQDKVTIDLPGAGRYFESPNGREGILTVARSQKCIIQPQEQSHATRQILASGDTTVARYSLRGGFQVLVCQGDITKQDADALVNAANEDLEHAGGVAAALSKAGGPQVQKESRALVKQTGKIPTGDVVVTTGGNLKCKKLLHAVGPVGGKSGGREGVLLEKTVQSALNLAEMMEFRSIAIPCISSGIFGVPVTVCSEAIVTAVKKFGSQGGRSLSRVDGLVSPMVSYDPLSTRVGNILSNIVGPQLTAKFHKEAGGATQPGGIVLLDGLPALHSKGVFFINLLPWDNNQQGPAVQVLRECIRKTLASCQIRGFSSVALPVVGTGAVLRFPHSVASRVLLEEVREFEHNKVTRNFLVRVVIHPNDKESSKAFQSAQKTLHLKGFTNDANPDQASFYRHVSITNDEVTAMLGGVKLQMVHGNIIQEHTDAIINTTNFNFNQSGVSQAILTAAGSTVQAELAQVLAVGDPADLMCTTGPGSLGCKEIIHASFMCDPQTIRKKCKKILKQCERKGFRSVAFPAINTGEGGMDSDKACKAMLDGMTSAITDLKPKSLTLIRIVILHQPVFQAFRSELENRFGQTAAPHLSLKEKAKQMLKKCLRGSSTSAPQVKAFTSSKPPPAVMSVIGCGADTIRIIKRDLEGILQKQLVEREVDGQDFSRLDAMELEAVQAKVKVFGISLEHKIRQSAEDGIRAGNTASDRSGSGREVYVLKGLKDDVMSVLELVNKAIKKALHEDIQDKKEATLALDVQWSIQNINRAWQEVSLHDNYVLEEAHMRKQVSVDIMAPDGKVELHPNSPEYKNVAKGFLKTAKYNILKIERVQNVYLWNAYSVFRQRLNDKNGQADLADASGLKRLYVARVLTGRYTVGNSSMKATPPRGSDPTDCFDSLVNNQQQPTMFVIFHDDQVYPEYLITFR
ncbi:hypothetical protein FQN60_006301 [Etheostoma spectabile]|uniref:Poly [ADP-ribose] polymerase n=1 Tax=Etheostoma spectabile TaxID=54343 RepID=A0A5J5CQH4_9PERO|nr:hypothetical protein FQN60_006301 [Etheostoma spectabile]